MDACFKDQIAHNRRDPVFGRRQKVVPLDDVAAARENRNAINAAIKAAGFNYGTGNTEPTPPVYLRLAELQGKWNVIKADVDRTTWAMEMALRGWRIAETDEARARAVAIMTDLLEAKATPPTLWPEDVRHNL